MKAKQIDSDLLEYFSYIFAQKLSMEVPFFLGKRQLKFLRQLKVLLLPCSVDFERLSQLVKVSECIEWGKKRNQG